MAVTCFSGIDENQNKVYIITSYEANLEIFESDYKTRKKK